MAGLLFGGGVWALAYLGIMPALGLYPPVDQEHPMRQATLIAAHAAYGITTAEVAQ